MGGASGPTQSRSHSASLSAYVTIVWHARSAFAIQPSHARAAKLDEALRQSDRGVDERLAKELGSPQKHQRDPHRVDRREDDVGGVQRPQIRQHGDEVAAVAAGPVESSVDRRSTTRAHAGARLRSRLWRTPTPRAASSSRPNRPVALERAAGACESALWRSLESR